MASTRNAWFRNMRRNMGIYSRPLRFFPAIAPNLWRCGEMWLSLPSTLQEKRNGRNTYLSFHLEECRHHPCGPGIFRHGHLSALERKEWFPRLGINPLFRAGDPVSLVFAYPGEAF